MKKAKTKSKNDPPGILDWIYDWVVKPIAFGMIGLADTVIKTIQTLKPDATAKEVFDAIMKSAEETPEIKPGVSVDEAEKQSLEIAWRQTETANKVNQIVLISEAATLGQVDVGVKELFNRPDYQATMKKAESVFLARFEDGVRPLLRRHWFQAYTPTLPDAKTLAWLATINPGFESRYVELMKELGISDEFSRPMRWLGETAVSFSELEEMLWRGLITEKDLTEHLRVHGMAGFWLSKYVELSKQIPPAADLVTMVVREAFDPKWVTPAPDIFAEYMTKKGFSKEWADRYWTMHWVRIPLAQAYDNYHRGLWTKERLLEELKLADFHPGIRDDIVNVAYRPPGLREMGYGYDVGVYTEKDIARYRRWGGLSPEDADKAAQAMVAYRTEAEREAVRREHLYLYSMGRESRTTFETNLKRLGTAPAAVPLWLERGDLQLERSKKPELMLEPRIISSSEALWALTHGLRDEAWTRAQLKALDWTDDRVDLAVERARVEPAPPAPPEYTAERNRLRDNAKTDLVKGYITEKDLRSTLETLGYTADEVEYNVQDAIQDRERKRKDLMVNELVDAYVKNLIETEVQLESLLSEYIVDPGLVEVMVDDAYIRRYKKPKAD